MLFNSFQFAVFFAAVLGLYLCLPFKWQNRLLLGASLFFYGWWDWRFLFLLAGLTGVNHACAVFIARTSSQPARKRALTLAVAVSLGVLFTFKYLNFFADSLEELLCLFGVFELPRAAKLVLPVGISFFTFQALSYTVDVYRGNLAPAPNAAAALLYVSFFPQLVAGPIERACHLLPQILSPRKPTREGFYEGSYLIFWGLFQKIFVADNLAHIVEQALGNPAPGGAQVLAGAYAFAFQIYGDFAGYSNIARGLGRCLGFDIMLNFNLPYFSRNPQEFWRRWHISLSSWLRDYLYIPLGGSRGKTRTTVRNLIVTMLLGGIWHGAAWTFALWGLYHGLLLVGHRAAAPLVRQYCPARGRLTGALADGVKVLLMFHAAAAGWLVFRAESFAHLAAMTRALASGFGDAQTEAVRMLFEQTAFYIGPLLMIEVLQLGRGGETAVLKLPGWLRTAVYTAFFYLMLFTGAPDAREFIYFQF